MRGLTRRELLFIIFLGALFPIYPALSLHGVSLSEVAIIAIVNAGLLPLFTSKGLNLKINYPIEKYLSSTYSAEEQRKIIKNYGRYKSRFFQNTPLFTREALNKDPNLRIYMKEAFKTILKLLTGGLCYLGILLLLFYIVVWL